MIPTPYILRDPLFFNAKFDASAILQALPASTIHYFNAPVQFNTASFSLGGFLPVMSAIKTEIVEVKESLNRHQEMLAEILTILRPSISEIEVEDVDEKEARSRILHLFKNSTGSLFYDDIAERLKLPLRQTVEICNQLEKDGLIGEPPTK